MANRRPPSATLSWHELGDLERLAEPGGQGESPETGDDLEDAMELRAAIKWLARTVRDLCVERDRKDESVEPALAGTTPR